MKRAVDFHCGGYNISEKRCFSEMHHIRYDYMSICVKIDGTMTSCNKYIKLCNKKNKQTLQRKLPFIKATWASYVHWEGKSAPWEKIQTASSQTRPGPGLAQSPPSLFMLTTKPDNTGSARLSTPPSLWSLAGKHKSKHPGSRVLRTPLCSPVTD